ncbi:MAG: uncharacterized protein PWQ57_2894 [Desulfovibrionales bacterium]|nr:uncharacterized protein [Desulfovibrionales bacterium]
MRKKQWEVTDPEAVAATLLEAEVLHLAMSRENRPYALTVNFGYKDGVIFIHSSLKGQKAATLRENPWVAFCAETRVAVTAAETACKWGATYRSVAGVGQSRFLESEEDKLAGLQIIMDHYTQAQHPFDNNIVAKTAVLAIVVEEISCHWKE